VPADVLKEVFQAETVLACDIGADVKLTGRQDYGDTLTTTQILLNMLPWSKALQVRLWLFDDDDDDDDFGWAGT
jgi:hypothetical protein